GVLLGGVNNDSLNLKSLMGMATDTSVGFYGYGGAGWGFTMDTRSGFTGIGNDIPLNKAGFVVDLKAGAVNALFGSNNTGVAIESNFPGIGFNSYYNGNRKTIASGYSGYIGVNPVAGGMQFLVSPQTNATNAVSSYTTALTILPNGRSGIGVSDPSFFLDVAERMRIRSAPGLSAGLWLNNDANNASPAFIGMRNDSLVGLFGSGSNWSFRMNTRTGNIGIGDVNPNAPLQFDNSVAQRKLVLYESANNDHQFYGFGVTSSVLRYQTATTGDDHVFYAGTGAGSSSELMRMKGNGYLGIGVADPVFRLDVKDRMRIRSGGDNSTSAGINFNNNANSLAAFVGMQTDNQVGLYGHNGAGWGLSMNTQNGALSVGGSTGNPGQVLTSNGAAASAGWTAAGNIIKTGFAGVLTTIYSISGSDFTELTNSAYTVTLNAPSRVILFCKTRTYSRSGILPLPVDYASRWRLEVWLNGTVSRTYNIEGLSRLGLAYTDNKLDLTTGPEYFDLPAGTHNFTFFATNLFGSSDVNMQVTSMIIPL
ncbi:MAG: hypothetical protein ACKVOW_02880, partial [Chitinophagaceae bacterium]